MYFIQNWLEGSTVCMYVCMYMYQIKDLLYGVAPFWENKIPNPNPSVYSFSCLSEVDEW